MIKFVVVVRKDLGMGVGKIAGQVGHAITKMVRFNVIFETGIFKEWFEQNNQVKVILKVNSEQELKDLMHVADIERVQKYSVHDAGKTQLEPNTLTCCGFGPDESDKLDKLLGHLKLL